MLFSFKHGFGRIRRIGRIYGAWWMCSYEAHRPYVNMSQESAQDTSWHFPLTDSHISCHWQDIIRVQSSRMPHLSSDNYWEAIWRILCPIRTSSRMTHTSSENYWETIWRIPVLWEASVTWFLSVWQRQTRRVGRFRQASLLAWMNITIWLQGRKPGERKQVLSV